MYIAVAMSGCAHAALQMPDSGRNVWLWSSAAEPLVLFTIGATLVVVARCIHAKRR